MSSSRRSTFSSPASDQSTDLLPDHAGNTAGAMLRTGDPVLEKANRVGARVTRPHISPGTALRLAHAIGGTTPAGRVRRNFDAAIIAADAVDTELDRAAARLDNFGTTHAGDTTIRCDTR